MDKRQTLSRPIDGGEEIFFIEWRRPPTCEAQARLRTLTQAQNQFHRQTGALLIPRRGTLSPWASKATDIAHRCGLDCRLERGLWFAEEKQAAAAHDRMTQTRLTPAAWRDWPAIFAPLPATVEEKIDLGDAPIDRLNEINARHGFALNAKEIEHLADCYHRLSRPPQLAELMMFAQANSEHCRHKTFRAAWTENGESLMDMIRRTHAAARQGTILAFTDNAPSSPPPAEKNSTLTTKASGVAYPPACTQSSKPKPTTTRPPSPPSRAPPPATAEKSATKRPPAVAPRPEPASAATSSPPSQPPPASPRRRHISRHPAAS